LLLHATGFGLLIQDLENPLAGCAPGLDELVEAMQAANWLVKEADQQEKAGEFADGHLPGEDFLATKGDDQHEPHGGEEAHRGVVHCPDAHHHERGFAELIAYAIEPRVL